MSRRAAGEISTNEAPAAAVAPVDAAPTVNSCAGTPAVTGTGPAAAVDAETSLRGASDATVFL